MEEVYADILGKNLGQFELVFGADTQIQLSFPVHLGQVVYQEKLEKPLTWNKPRIVIHVPTAANSGCRPDQVLNSKFKMLLSSIHHFIIGCYTWSSTIPYMVNSH